MRALSGALTDMMTIRVRDFSKAGDAIEVPNLVELQMSGYRRFLQPDCLPEERAAVGLEGIFREFFPMESEDGSLRIEYLGYEIGPPLMEVEECRHLGLTYAGPLRARLRIVGTESVEEEVYLGRIPTMIGSGQFVINGADRVVVAQIQRSPGVDFGEESRESGQRSHSCRFVPERGTWMEWSVTRRETLQVRLGQSGLMPATWLLWAMLPEGVSVTDILGLFYELAEVALGEPGARGRLVGSYLAGDVVESETGEVLAEVGSAVGAELAERLMSSGMEKVVVLRDVDDPLMLRTFRADPCKGREEALLRIYARFRPGEPGSVERAKLFFAERFADERNYHLGKVGRFRINRKLGGEVPEDRMTLCAEDVISAIKYLMGLRRREGSSDDIDDLGNRILRTVDKLLEEGIRDGFVRWRRELRDRLVLEEGRVPSPRQVAGTRAVAAAIEVFFGRSELSQVVDQTNPLAELNHVRRISALGPGGLNRKRAGFEVRDVHASHYGRICPIETPEGANIGLIASLGIFARVDEYGFITTPYRGAGGGAGGIRYLRADEEGGLRLAPAGVQGEGERVAARCRGEVVSARLSDLDFVDVSPKQIVGISAGLIPFLEHNDANRALMGSNMQRQAVPLLRPELPLVATGMEKAVGRHSSMVVVARRSGTVTAVDASRVEVGEEAYALRKFVRLNEDTCLNQKPIVREGQRVEAGEVIADGAATCGGELSLGRNVLVAFMIWDGYNFEDAIIVSDSLVRSDKYTSIHVEEFAAELRESRLGREEFTRDIPSVSGRTLANLDEGGVVRVGTHVDPGDILVGKVAPKSKVELTPEERLVREIFGKSGIEVTNESLVLPPGSGGVVVEVRRYRRRTHLPEAERDEDRREARRVGGEYDARASEEFSGMIGELSGLPRAGGASAEGVRRLPVIPPSATVRELLHMEGGFRFDLNGFAPEARAEARRIYLERRRRIRVLQAKRDRLVRRLRVGDELPPGVMESVKVTVATRRRLSAGDKMAGRHGNKGVIARIVSHEDMPFLPDGTPVEIILNPLGVPSRMNVGQILETHLGWAGRVLGFRAITPVFDGATEGEIGACLREAGLPEDGKTVLCDGRTGERFDQKVTVGYIYMMKLNHLVDDKVHVRATGPYSLITQQPLGGKARMGGQRVGEMEVWALEAYGAAFLLQEMLTTKSDDVDGRARLYESVVKGRNVHEAGLPVSFDVLVEEMRGLGLDLQLEKGAGGGRVVRRVRGGTGAGARAFAAAERR